MADFQNFAITRGDAVNATIPSYRIEVQVVDSTTNEVLNDFTGDNAIRFPDVFATLTVEDRDEMVNNVANWLIMKRAGL